MKPQRPVNLHEVSARLEKLLQAKYKDIYVGSGYGLYNYPGPEAGWFLRIQHDDESVWDQFPKEFEGYPVTVSGIAVAQ
jgi:hypothetical protein